MTETARVNNFVLFYVDCNISDMSDLAEQNMSAANMAAANKVAPNRTSKHK